MFSNNDSLLLIIGVIILTFFILIRFTIAKLFERLSRYKGYDEDDHIFLFCFILGVFGVIYTVALPTKINCHPSPISTDNNENKQMDGIKKRIDDLNDQSTYNQALKKMKDGASEKSIVCYSQAIKLLSKIPNYSDAKVLIENCANSIMILSK